MRNGLRSYARNVLRVLVNEHAGFRATLTRATSGRKLLVHPKMTAGTIDVLMRHLETLSATMGAKGDSNGETELWKAAPNPGNAEESYPRRDEPGRWGPHSALHDGNEYRSQRL